MKKKSLRTIFGMALALTVMLTMLAGLAGCKKSESTETEAGVQETEETTEETSAPETTAETTEETTEEETEALISEPYTFYFFGVDTVGYTAVDKGRSDIIKVVQVNPVDKTIKMAAILRDSKVPIEGYDPQKINAAYQLGGADLAMSTVNTNYNLDIHNYVMLNFSGLVQFIDDVGGVDVEISQDEADIINSSRYDYVGDGRTADFVEVAAGMAHLDGTQTLCLSRIRKIDSDYYRADRQHRISAALQKKLKTMTVTDYIRLVGCFQDVIETNIPADVLMAFATMGLEDYTYSAIITPDYDYDDITSAGIDETGSWVWQYDLEKSGARIADFLKTEETSESAAAGETTGAGEMQTSGTN